MQSSGRGVSPHRVSSCLRSVFKTSGRQKLSRHWDFVGYSHSCDFCVRVCACVIPQVVHEAYSRFTEESLTQSVCEKPTESTEVTIKVSGESCQIRCRRLDDWNVCLFTMQFNSAPLILRLHKTHWIYVIVALFVSFL